MGCRGVLPLRCVLPGAGPDSRRIDKCLGPHILLSTILHRSCAFIQPSLTNVPSPCALRVLILCPAHTGGFIPACNGQPDITSLYSRKHLTKCTVLTPQLCHPISCLQDQVPSLPVLCCTPCPCNPLLVSPHTDNTAPTTPQERLQAAVQGITASHNICNICIQISQLSN